KPPTAKLLTPNVGPTVVLMSAASANLKTSCGRSKTRAPPANLFTSQAPQSASNVLPLAMPREVKIFPAVVRLTTKAPTKIAGQTRNPRTSNAASAMPAGGQTGDALALRKARCSESLPEMKKTNAKALIAGSVGIFLAFITRPPVRIALPVTRLAPSVNRFVNNWKITLKRSQDRQSAPAAWRVAAVVSGGNISNRGSTDISIRCRAQAGILSNRRESTEYRLATPAGNCRATSESG